MVGDRLTSTLVPAIGDRSGRLLFSNEVSAVQQAGRAEKEAVREMNVRGDVRSWRHRQTTKRTNNNVNLQAVVKPLHLKVLEITGSFGKRCTLIGVVLDDARCSATQASSFFDCMKSEYNSINASSRAGRYSPSSGSSHHVDEQPPRCSWCHRWHEPTILALKLVASAGLPHAVGLALPYRRGKRSYGDDPNALITDLAVTAAADRAVAAGDWTLDDCPGRNEIPVLGLESIVPARILRHRQAIGRRRRQRWLSPNDHLMSFDAFSGRNHTDIDNQQGSRMPTRDDRVAMGSL